MPNIYSNAYVTISVANAGACSKGFLKYHGDVRSGLEPNLGDDLIKMPYKWPNGILRNAFFRKISPYQSM